MANFSSSQIRKVRALDADLLNRFGPQGWWPTTTRPGLPPVYRPGREGRRLRHCERWEIMVGAILTQNTAWRNVVKALCNLTAFHPAPDVDAIAIETLADAGPWLEEKIRPSGYFNQKADRLRRTARTVLDCGGLAALEKIPTPELRSLFLGWHGIGPETADSFLCYAFNRPVFVVDAYTRRLFASNNLPCGSYAEMQALVHEAFDANDNHFGDLHARIVRNFT